MTTRDRYILIALGAIGLLAALWFLVIGPKRNELTKLNKDIAKSEEQVQAARQNATEFAEARLSFPRTYAAMVRLGKAVPADPDVPSLLVQLEHAAEVAGVDFRKVELKGGEEGEGQAPPAPPPPSSGGEGGGQAAGQGSTPQSGAGGSQPAASGGAAPSTPASGQAPGGGSAAPQPSGAQPQGGAAPAPADAVTAATAPIGTTVGPAGFPVIQLTLRFQGNFFKMADLVHQLKALVEQRNKRLVVSGRLVSIDGMVFGEGDAGFPQVTATVAATTYLIPSAQGLLAGATSQGPSADTPAPSTPAPATPPTAVVSGP